MEEVGSVSLNKLVITEEEEEEDWMLEYQDLHRNRIG